VSRRRVIDQQHFLTGLNDPLIGELVFGELILGGAMQGSAA
jgi:hypothetical protein